VTLESAQRSFWGAMRDHAVPTESIERCFRGDARLSARDRVLVYRRAYWARQIDALRDEFRRVADRLGERDFGDLMHEYLVAHPSSDPRIEWIGGALPRFLRAHRLEQHRALADLAAFEWAEVEALLATDPPCLTSGFDVPATAFPACTFEMVPALRVVALTSDPLPDPGGARRPTAFAVWRFGFAVQHRRLDPDEHRAATAALAGEPVASVCEAFGHRPDAAERASTVLKSWLTSAWVSRIVQPTRIDLP
jgi:hypothetical protein